LNKRVRNIVFAGVGGQGNILASKIVAEAARFAGLECIVGEVYGVSQRGGSVLSHARVGTDVLSPVTPESGADVICGFEPLEALRAAVSYSNKQTIIFVNLRSVQPIAVSAGKTEYPSFQRIVKALNELCGKVIELDASALAEEVGGSIYMNMIFLGALSSLRDLGIPLKSYEEAISANVPKALDLNLKAFYIGRDKCQRESATV
jgi:indolepyruvate ferredoxin oxidoreductase, beta subunit